MTWLTWSLLSALFAALTAILAKIGVSNVNSNLATAIRTSVVVVFTWLLVLLEGQALKLNSVPPKTWMWLALSGIATGLSWLCYFRALQIGEASRVAPVDKLSVVFVMILAVLIFGERLTWTKGLGAVLISAGAAIIALK